MLTPPADAVVNYVLPNEAAHVTWSLMIVIYPYITGLVAGAFVVSALYHVVKIQDFKPIANFALVAALCFGLFAGVPLLFHLGQPQRALNIYITPHTTSAMSLFGYAYGSYMVVLTLEIWLIYRVFFIRRFQETRGFQRLIWYGLTLGVTEYHPQSGKLDHTLSTILAGLGIPWACMLHGYVGFIFGSVKANPWWATPLQPIIFLTSAVVSGIAMLTIMYCVIKAWDRTGIDCAMVKKLLTILWAIFIFDYALELLEWSHAYYLNSHEWAFIGPLLGGPLKIPYYYGQIGLLSIAPIVMLGYASLSKGAGKMMLVVGNLASLLILMQVLVMRYCVVIGGQQMSKAGRGYIEFHWELLGREGVIATVGIFCCPFIVYAILNRFIPIFEDPAGPEATEH
jgi:Ni/Fe-hydrogenase subunit HybB-like protein